MINTVLYVVGSYTTSNLHSTNYDKTVPSSLPQPDFRLPQTKYNLWYVVYR